MIIERNFTKFVVFEEDSLLIGLNKINDNKSRVVFAVSESGRMAGVLTDGDLRRWLTSASTIDLSLPVSRVMNKDYVWSAADASPRDVEKLFNVKIAAIPLLDTNRRLVAVAMPRHRHCDIAGRVIDDASPVFLIAEVGNNHNGSFDMARRLVDEAVKAGADCVKFQMRNLTELYRNAGDANDTSADLGAQYTLDLLSRFQLAEDDMYRMFEYCSRSGVIPMCTPWDMSSLAKLEGYGLPAYKVASADFTNYELLDAVAGTGKPMICSTGMATETEIRDGVQRLQRSGAQYVLLHCNSTYPAPFKDVNLRYMLHLKEISDSLVGYSGHERDINVALCAVSLGARVVEKHFTLDRSMEGNDHKVSLLPNEFARLVLGVRQIEEALGSAGDRTMSQGELMNREQLAKSLVAAVDIPAGVMVTDEMVRAQSPGQGLQPNQKHRLIGRVLTESKKAGDFFFANDVGESRAKARDYRFKRPWGIPVRYHDLQKFRRMSNMDFLEIHLSYKDMESNFRHFIPDPLPLGLVVHAPELFAGDHTLDLCSPDSTYRARSLREMQRVIDLTRELKAYFVTGRPFIITNVGGFSRDGHLSKDGCRGLYGLFEESLKALDMDGVEILPQTMPPFPWHFGGQQYHNLFVTAVDIEEFCARTQMRVCLDVSHSKLACNNLKQPFSEFLSRVTPHAAHLHLADASGVDGEGLQIGQGDVDWAAFWNAINASNPKCSFIPEVWQSHKNDGEGMWCALEELEKYSRQTS